MHGYIVSWHDAILRTAQMAHDLQIDGPAISYTWPSAANPALYYQDLQNASWTALDLAAVIRNISQKTGLTKVHVVAHSLGAYALSLALKKLQETHLDLTNIHDIALAAPDVDPDTFTTQYADAFRATTKHLTIYESRRDFTLQKSKDFNGFLRLGDASTITMVPGFDVVDATRSTLTYLGMATSPIVSRW